MKIGTRKGNPRGERSAVPIIHPSIQFLSPLLLHQRRSARVLDPSSVGAKEAGFGPVLVPPQVPAGSTEREDKDEQAAA